MGEAQRPVETVAVAAHESHRREVPAEILAGTQLNSSVNQRSPCTSANTTPLHRNLLCVWHPPFARSRWRRCPVCMTPACRFLPSGAAKLHLRSPKCEIYGLPTLGGRREFDNTVSILSKPDVCMNHALALKGQCAAVHCERRNKSTPPR